MNRRKFLQVAGTAGIAAEAIGAQRVQPTASQKAWLNLHYGMFLHFGPNTILGVGWGDGKFPPAQFAPRKLDCAQWAEVARQAGMKYAVLTTKHHDGFCLWPSRHTEYCVRNSPAGDVVRPFVEEFRKVGLKVGFYYSLWDRNYPQYENDAVYAQYMRDQITELLTGYGEIVELWFDGAWDKDYPTRRWEYDPAWERDPNSGLKHGERWQWGQLYETIHRLQPDCLVLNNSSSDRPGEVRYHPVDARTSEHLHFIFKQRLYEARLDPMFQRPDGQSVYLPLEYNTTLTPDWFWNRQGFLIHASAATIADWYRTAQSHNANFLLNIGPNADGLIPGYHLPFLRGAAAELKLGG
jgi:alpha-L-fucosidase